MTLARLAYTAADGTPRVVPIWLHWTGNAIVMVAPPGAIDLAVESGVGPSRQAPRASGPRPLAGPGGALSPRETEVLQLVAAGVTNAGIAARLVLSINTVERHVRNVYGKLGVTNRAEATAMATRAGLSHPPGPRSHDRPPGARVLHVRGRSAGTRGGIRPEGADR